MKPACRPMQIDDSDSSKSQCSLILIPVLIAIPCAAKIQRVNEQAFQKRAVINHINREQIYNPRGRDNSSAVFIFLDPDMASQPY